MCCRHKAAERASQSSLFGTGWLIENIQMILSLSYQQTELGSNWLHVIWFQKLIIVLFFDGLHIIYTIAIIYWFSFSSEISHCSPEIISLVATQHLTAGFTKIISDLRSVSTLHQLLMNTLIFYFNDQSAVYFTMLYFGRLSNTLKCTNSPTFVIWSSFT